jgi:hypothetical protein
VWHSRYLLFVCDTGANHYVVGNMTYVLCDQCLCGLLDATDESIPSQLSRCVPTLVAHLSSALRHDTRPGLPSTSMLVVAGVYQHLPTSHIITDRTVGSLHPSTVLSVARFVDHIFPTGKARQALLPIEIRERLPPFLDCTGAVVRDTRELNSTLPTDGMHAASILTTLSDDVMRVLIIRPCTSGMVFIHRRVVRR